MSAQGLELRLQQGQDRQGLLNPGVGVTFPRAGPGERFRINPSCLIVDVSVITYRSLSFFALGLVLFVVPGGPGPQNPGLERPDAQRRGRVDPASPPPGYYEATDRRSLRRQVRQALAAVKHALKGGRSS